MHCYPTELPSAQHTAPTPLPSGLQASRKLAWPKASWQLLARRARRRANAEVVQARQGDRRAELSSSAGTTCWVGGDFTRRPCQRSLHHPVHATTETTKEVFWRLPPHTHTHSLSACRGQQHRTKQASGWTLNKAAPMTAFPCTRARQQLAAWSQMCFTTSPGSQPHNLLTPAPSSGHVCVLRPAQGPSPGTAVLLGQLRCHETQLRRSGPGHLAPNKSSSVAGIGHPCST